MKTKQLMISGFVSYAILEMLGMLSALFSGRLHSLPYEFAWEKFFRISITFSIGVGFLGVIIGYFFGKLQNRIPLNSVYAKSIAYHIAVLILMSFYKGVSYLTSFDFAFSFVSTLFIAWFFIWFYKLTTKETANLITNNTSI